jgi:SAM-dependent methyltransferase
MSGPGWFLDELGHAGPEHLDAAYVADYERKAGVDPTDDVALLRGLGLDPSASVVDLGAGTGVFSLGVAPLCRRVVAVDVSPAMLEALRATAASLGVRNVVCVQGGFLTYDHGAEPVDVVYTRNALHHLPDFWKAVALRRIGAMVGPGGVLRLRDLVYSFEPDEVGGAIEAWLAAAPEQPEDGWTRSELETHVREEHSTFSWLLEPLIERAGFEIRDATYSESRTFAAYTCVRR